MLISFSYQRLLRSFAACLICLGFVMPATIVFAQSEVVETNIDPRLIEVTQIVKKRAIESALSEDLMSKSLTADAQLLNYIDSIRTASYSREPQQIITAVDKFNKAYRGKGEIGLSRVSEVYLAYADLLNKDKSSSELKFALSGFSTEGNWFERYIALSLLGQIHGNDEERQAALKKAQLALSVIPTRPNPETETYISYAKASVISTIAQLHNLQGNSDLALDSSLSYLRSTEGNSDSRVEVDLINNLIYSYSLARNHDAQLYLSRQLLEIEKTQSSSVAGLSEMRIAGVMNSSGQYADGLGYAKRSVESAANPTVIRIARVNEAIALAGLGRLDEARQIAKLADVNLNRRHMLTSETGKSNLYLAFLLAQAEDREYATQLYNRQLDVSAQKFLANNSRDTTAMLAELENSHERQSERDAAAARESELQALTIKRHRNLNRALTVLSVLMALAMFAAILFIRFRGRVLRKLEIKTREAASAEKLKTEFLGMISHELRTPLNGIIGISDFLTNHHADDDIRSKSSIILRSGNELLSVVESLTDMARIDAGQLKLLTYDADLGASLAAIPEQWTQKANEKGLAFTAFIDPAITAHHLDEDRILQCINILLANAISFTNSGRVHLHVTASKTAPHSLTAIVADTGQGMSELVQSRLFTPFMQADTSRKRNHMGTGLNLAIAYALVEMMEGSLTVVSREGRGSEFTLTIPLKPAIDKTAIVQRPLIEAETIENTAPKSSAERPSPPITASPITTALSSDNLSEARLDLGAPVLESAGAPQRDYVDLMQPNSPQMPGLHRPESRVQLDASERPLRILIVDDISSNRDILRLILESKGHICREAPDGFTALAILDRQVFDTVIMDIHMAPMDGVEAIRRIRASGKSYENIPVIALTADDDPNVNAESMEVGANLFLNKPVRRNELLRNIDYLRQSESVRILSRQA